MRTILVVIGILTILVLLGCSERGPSHGQITKPGEQHPSYGALCRFTDGTADWSELVKVAQHLRECDECTRRATLLAAHLESIQNRP